MHLNPKDMLGKFGEGRCSHSMNPYVHDGTLGYVWCERIIATAKNTQTSTTVNLIEKWTRQDLEIRMIK